MISVVIPYMANEVFENVIKSSINSLLNTNYRNTEFILVSVNPSATEDYSFFNEFKIIEAFSQIEDNMIHSGGFAWALNIGIKAAKYPFIFTTGIDMLYPTDCLERIVKTLSKKRVAIIEKEWIDGNNKVITDSYFHIGFHKKDAISIGGYDERMLGGSNTDIDFWSRIVKLSGRKHDRAKVLLKHLEHPVPYKENRFDESKFNKYLAKTNPIKVGIDSPVGNLFAPPFMAGNLVDLEYLILNPFKHQMKRYSKPFDLQYSKEWEVPYLIKYTAPYKLKCLDAGCGLSPFPRWLSDYRKCEVTAIDNESDSYHTIPDKRLWGKVQYKHADIRDIPFKDQTFQRVYCVSVLEHLPKEEVKIAITELGRVCSGLIGISIDFRFLEEGVGFNENDVRTLILEPISDTFEPIYPLDFTASQEHFEMLKDSQLAIENYSFAAFILGRKEDS